MSKLTDDLIKAGVKSREQQSAENKIAYDKSPITAVAETIKEGTTDILKKYGIYIAGAVALLLFARKK
jgi:hypothetical protein